MTPQQFGQLALQLLAAAQIPGEALDAAMQFRGVAQGLALGKLSIIDSVSDATNETEIVGGLK